MSIRHIGLDIDGVVADFPGAVERWVKNVYGYDPVPVDCWDWFMQWPDGKMVWRTLYERGVTQDEVFLDCVPIEGAINGVDWLIHEGYDLTFVTNRPENSMEQTAQWLIECGWYGVPILHTDDKSELGADLYIDDYGENVRALVAGGNEAWLFHQAWNAEYDDLDRVMNWPHLKWCLSDPGFEPDGAGWRLVPEQLELA